MKKDLIKIFNSAVGIAHPAGFMRDYLEYSDGILRAGKELFRLRPESRLLVIGAGKAGAAMAVETEIIFGNRINGGLVVTKYGHSLPLKYLTIVESGHPVPDQNGIEAARQIENLLKDLNENDLVICLISGGASALLADVPEGITLEEMRRTVSLLLDSGAHIGEINTVRKHLSYLKGGQLLRLISPATAISLIISDVPGDDPGIIASGLTSPDSSRFEDALEVIKKYKLETEIPEPVLKRIRKGVRGEIPETIKAEDSILNNVRNILVATNKMGLEEAAKASEKIGYRSLIVNENLEGEAADRGKEIAEFLIAQNPDQPHCYLWGGETTVTIQGYGMGGRNQELALSALLRFTDFSTKDKEIFLLVSGTDGTDGPTDANGAMIDNSLIVKAARDQGQILDHLRNNDSYHYFAKHGGHFITGPTNTNVMDLVIALVMPAKK